MRTVDTYFFYKTNNKKKMMTCSQEEEIDTVILYVDIILKRKIHLNVTNLSTIN